MGDKQEANWGEMKQEFDRRQMPEEQVNVLKTRIEQAKRDRRRLKMHRRMRSLTAVAAAVALFVILPNTSAQVAHAMSSIPFIGKLVDVVTFRDYQYSSDRNNADVQVPALIVERDETEEKSEQNPEEIESNLQNSTDEINAEIQRISNEVITEFEKNLKYEWGYQDVLVKSEIATTTEDYFTLKLIVYQGAGSGMEWNYFYTIDLNTGKCLALKDLFTEGADYITPISEDIKRQMQERMDADENEYYWLHDEVEEWNFKSITEETSFYVDESGNVVMVFNEGEVAPMYMGVVSFMIPSEVLEGIRK